MTIAATHSALVPGRQTARSPALVLGALFVALIVAAGIAASVGAA
jgi:hypothetical protein